MHLWRVEVEGKWDIALKDTFSGVEIESALSSNEGRALMALEAMVRYRGGIQMKYRSSMMR